MDAIDKRKSVRKYKETFLSADEITKILHMIENPMTGPNGNEIELEFIVEDLNSRKGKIGTYGFISGKYGAILGWCQKERLAYIDYGYVLENISLKLVDMNLGTCWLGGSFSKKNVIDAMRSSQNGTKNIPAILTVGYEAQGKRLRDFLISGIKRKRMDFNECYFDKDLNIIDDKDKIKILEAVRWSPSAMNRQPVRVIWDESRAHFYLVDAKIELRYIDMGIAMCHFEKRAKEMGMSGSWLIDSNAPDTDWLYMNTFGFE